MINTVIKLVQIARGDISKKQSLADGEIFWQYKNSAPDHPFSEGQLFVGQKGKNIEVANARSIDALKYRGSIGLFRGDFENTTIPNFQNIHTGDFWFADKSIPKEESDFGLDIFENDMLLITEASDSKIEWTKVSFRAYNNEASDLEAKTVDEAISKLEARMLWCGPIHSEEELKALEPKHNGSTYYIDSEFVHNGVTYPAGSILVWDAKSQRFAFGLNDHYTPNVDGINAAQTLSDAHKSALASAKSWTEAIHILNVAKAELDAEGHIPVEQLPDSIVGALRYRGFWDPIASIESNIGVAAVTQEQADDSSNQDPFPSSPISGDYFIVNFGAHLEDLQYKDGDRTFTLNQGDYIIFNKARDEDEGHWEYINNASKIKALFFKPTGSDEIVKVTGTPTFSVSGNLSLEVINGECIIHADNVLAQDANNPGEAYNVPRYSPEDQRLLQLSDIFSYLDKVQIRNDLEIGQAIKPHNASIFGTLTVESTRDVAGNPIQHSIDFESFIEANQDNYVERVTRLWSSKRNQFKDIDREVLNIFLPEASSTLVGVLEGDSLKPTFLTKSTYDGYVESTKIAEQFDREDVDYVAAFFGGRIQSKDVDLSKATFYDFNNDNDLDREDAFRFVSLALDPRFESNKTIAYLPGARSGEVHLATVEDIDEVFDFGRIYSIPRFIKRVKVDGEEQFAIAPSTVESHIYGSQFETKDGTVIDDSDLNEVPAYKNGPFSFEEFLAARGKSHNKTADARDNRTTFDSWLHSRRAISTEEGFALPSSAYDNEGNQYDSSISNPSRKFAAFVASKTKFVDSPVYMDFDDNPIDQDIEKIIELPAESGVLMTDNSRIECGVIVDVDDYFDCPQYVKRLAE